MPGGVREPRRAGGRRRVGREGFGRPPMMREHLQALYPTYDSSGILPGR
jgi:hypothetical protein